MKEGELSSAGPGTQRVLVAGPYINPYEALGFGVLGY